VYLRPAPRTEFISSLTRMGVFVREFATPLDEEVRHASRSAEFAIFFADDTPEHGHLVRTFTTANQSSLVILSRDPQSASVDFGAALMHHEAASAGSFGEAVVHVGRVARARRGYSTPRVGSSRRVFGELNFLAETPCLTRGHEVESLTPVEHAVLRILAESQGIAVSKARLRQCLTNSSREGADGYLKAIVLRLRRKAERLGGDASLLAAIRGFGYVLKA
jgi:hypothetical protein